MDISKQKGYKQLYDDDGQFICNVMEYDGANHSPFSNDFVDRLDSFKNDFTVNDSDVFLLSYVKSGTHWLWEILMMLSKGSATPRKEFKESVMLEIASREELEAVPEPRIINTHLPPESIPESILLNDKCKLIQIHRNPKDVAVSFYHHASKEQNGLALAYDWSRYIDKLYTNNEMMPHLTWFDYVQRWWPYSKQNNFLLVFYEEILEDPVREVKKIAEFLGVPADDALVKEIAINTSFKKMKISKSDEERQFLAPYFEPGFSMYRKGVVGDWQNYFTEEQTKRFDLIYEERMKDFPELYKRVQFLSINNNSEHI